MIRTTFAVLILCFCRLNAQHWVWAKQSDSISGNLSFSRIARDEPGMFYLSISDFSSNYPFPAVGSTLIKYDVSGNELWRKNFPGSFTIEELTTSKHCVYLTGHFTNNLRSGTTTVLSAGSADIFVAKFDPAGNFQWIKTFGSQGNDLGMGITSDPSGLIYVTGEFSKTVAFGSFSLTSTSKHSAFLLKMDPSGQVLSAKKFSCDQPGGTACGNKLKIDSQFNTYWLGYFDAPMHMDTIAVNNNGQPATVLGKLDANLDVLWANTVSSNGCMTSALTIDQYDEVSTETGCTGSPGGGKIFTTRYNSAGQVSWSASLFPPHPTDDIYSQSCAACQKNVLVAGNNWNCPVGGTCYQQLFIADYDPLGALTFLDTSNCAGKDLSRIQIEHLAPTLFLISGTLDGDLALGSDVLQAPSPHIFIALYSIEKSSDIQNTETGSLSVYPNPASGIVTITGARTRVSIRLFDNLGTCLLNSQANKLDLSEYPAGIYFIELSQAGHRCIKKLVHY